jgi:LysM repeat protein
MASHNEILHTVSDLDAGLHRHNLSNFIQDLQQQRTQHPQETQQYLASCNSALEQAKVLPGLQIEGLNAKGDRAVFNTARGEISVGVDGSYRPLQPGEMAAVSPGATAKPIDYAPQHHTAGDAETIGKSGHDTAGKSSDLNNTSGKASDATYTVNHGDTVWRIARNQLGDDASPKDVYALVKSIAKENGMSNFGQTIHPQQTLKIPGDRSQPTPPQTIATDDTDTPVRYKIRHQTRPAERDPDPPPPRYYADEDYAV